MKTLFLVLATPFIGALVLFGVTVFLFLGLLAIAGLPALFYNIGWINEGIAIAWIGINFIVIALAVMAQQ